MAALDQLAINNFSGRIVRKNAYTYYANLQKKLPRSWVKVLDLAF